MPQRFRCYIDLFRCFSIVNIFFNAAPLTFSKDKGLYFILAQRSSLYNPPFYETEEVS